MQRLQISHFVFLMGVFLFGSSASVQSQSLSKREVLTLYKQARSAMKASNYEKASLKFFDVIEGGEAFPLYQRYARFRMANALLKQGLPLLALDTILKVLSKTNIRNKSFDPTQAPNPDRAYISALSGLLKTAEKIGDETYVITQLRKALSLVELPQSTSLLKSYIEDPIRYLLPVPKRFEKQGKLDIVKTWESTRGNIRDNIYFFVGRHYFSGAKTAKEEALNQKVSSRRNLKRQGLFTSSLRKALGKVGFASFQEEHQLISGSNCKSEKDATKRSDCLKQIFALYMQKYPVTTFDIAKLYLKNIQKDAVNNYYPKALYMLGIIEHTEANKMISTLINAFSKQQSKAYQEWKWKQALSRNLRAIKTFEKILSYKSLTQNTSHSEELIEIKKEARYAISQVYYAMGFALDRTMKTKEGYSNYNDSLKGYRRVPLVSKIPQARVLFESAYVHFMKEEYHFALGKLIALKSPYYRTGFFPELDILKALIFFKNCKYGDTKETLEKFQKEFMPLQKKLVSLVKKRKDNSWSLPRFFAFFLEEEKNLKQNKSSLPPSVITLLQQQKELKNYRALLRSLGGELSAIQKKGRSWKESNLGRELKKQGSKLQSKLKSSAGNAVSNSLSDVNADVLEQLGQSQLISLQTLQQQKEELRRYAEGGGIEQDEYPYTIVTEQTHIYWPFQGEFWRDEVAHYRRFIQGECKR